MMPTTTTSTSKPTSQSAHPVSESKSVLMMVRDGLGHNGVNPKAAVTAIAELSKYNSPVAREMIAELAQGPTFTATNHQEMYRRMFHEAARTYVVTGNNKMCWQVMGLNETVTKTSNGISRGGNEISTVFLDQTRVCLSDKPAAPRELEEGLRAMLTVIRTERVARRPMAPGQMAGAVG